MDVETNLRVGLQQLAGVLAEDISDLADGELGEVRAAAGHVDRCLEIVVVLVLDEIGHDMVDDGPAFQGGTHFEGADPAVLRQTGIDDRLIPLVLSRR